MEFPKVEQPDFKIQLFPHQLTSIYNMEKLESNNRVFIHEDQYIDTKLGILADIPGYGKSYSILGLIERDKMKWDMSTDFEQTYHSDINYYYNTVHVERFTKIRPNLLLVSNSVFSQWQEYISNTNIKTYYVANTRSIEKIKKINPIFQEPSEKQIIDINEYDLVVVNTNFYNPLIEYLGNVAWKRFIYDDPSTLYVKKMKHIACGFLWLITATPHYFASPGNIYEQSFRYHFMKRLFVNITYTKLHAFSIKNPDEYVKSSFSMPQIIKHYHTCKKTQVLKAIGSYISENISNMISAGDIKGAIYSLGGDEMENIIEVVGKRKLSDIKHAQFKIEHYFTRNLHGDDKLVEEWKQHLATFEKEYEDIKQKYKDLLSEECVICADSLKDPILTPCCQTIMCGKCILEWVYKKNTCIMCRKQIDPSCLHIITKDLDGNPIKNEEVVTFEEEQVEEKNKQVIKVIQKIKEKNKDAKIILFSDYDATFDVVYNILKETKLSFKDIQGSIGARTRIIKEFNQGKIDMIFLNSKFNGSGINLTETTDIIIYHSMHVSNTEQIIGRALRIGRKEDLHLHEFTEI